ncbi:MAG: DUF481 domain-containing protein [Desulfarculaceae bacterium]|nr:DUF481 domain-containing protein [Desulfarculaceae bacterium]MCF8071284.1 DUF481 domain-containing protein [Desulfarculaceae bacterium]MCF8101113.1 DUF481 domain-containing protein [Desulfarculaceae bacterium]MCF8115338.1 DUF481 domain-containing protein [Desulfarculaceae bacterium]
MNLPPSLVRIAFTSLLLCLLAAAPALADVVQMKNGDRLSGTIEEMGGGKLLLDTKYAGKLKIKWSEVQSIQSDQPLTVETSEGKMVTGKAGAAGPGQIKLGGAPALALKQVEAINPEDLDPFKLSGQVNLGVDISRGNTNKQTIDTMGRGVMTWKTINRAVAGFEIHEAQSGGVDTTDNSLGYIDYNRFISEKWYWLANLRGEQDRFKNIDFRGMTGLGMGYQVWRSKKTNLLFELGPDFVYLEEAGGNTSDWFAWRWHIGYDRWLFNHWVQFYHRQTGFVAMDNFDNWIWSARQGLNFPLVMGFVLTTSFNIDYDNQPEPGKSKTDTRFVLSLGYQF